jgi:hypothetical protein
VGVGIRKIWNSRKNLGKDLIGLRPIRYFPKKHIYALNACNRITKSTEEKKSNLYTNLIKVATPTPAMR